MLAEIFMLKAETAARVAKGAVPRFVPITLPAARPVGFHWNPPQK